MNIKIFHHNDQDGHCAAAIASYEIYLLSKLKDKEGELALSNEDLSLVRGYATRSMFIESDYASRRVVSPAISDGDLVYILDYSFSKNTLSDLKEICQKASKVIWLDHHLSSKRLLDDGDLEGIENLTYHIDMKWCGAVLAWNYFYPGNSVPKFLEYVDDYDCWKKSLGEATDAFHIGMDMNSEFPWSETWTGLITDGMIQCGIEPKYDVFEDYSVSNVMLRVLNEGRIAKKYIDSANRNFYKTFHFVNSSVFGVETDCCNMKTNSWVFGTSYGTYPLYCIFGFNGKVWTYSLYSMNPEIDCSQIAEKFGGGGHKGAAGFSTRHCLFDNVEVEE